MSDYLTLGQAAQRTPNRPSAGTIWRWARHGIVARDGSVVRLQHIRIGGRVFTTEQWLHQFFEEVAKADLGHAAWQHPKRRSISNHQRADEVLQEAGL